jgi:carbamoyl-phosphate synthase large subunit
MKGILLLSAGRRVSLLHAFLRAAGKSSEKIGIHAGDADPDLSAACKVADHSVKLPRIRDDQFIPFLKNYCSSNNIKIIIPTIDTELLILSSHRDEFEKAGIYIMVPGTEFTAVCRNKRWTHDFFNRHGIAVAAELSEPFSYPVFVKPVDGSSSNQLFYAPDATYLPPFVLKNDRFMILEYLDRKVHTEYTIDAYYNREGKLCCAVPRRRLETRGGEISKGYTKKNFLVKWMREKFNVIPSCRGCITFQFFVKGEHVTGIEINPRFGGGYPLSWLAGADYPAWIISEYIFNKKIDWYDAWEDNLLMLRHDNEIIVHDYPHSS